MSEGEIHARLVEVTLGAIQAWAPPDSLTLWADHPRSRTYAPPFRIGGSEADIIAVRRDTNFAIIGEAKTRRDISNVHSRKQLKDYFEFLVTQPDGLLWFSVPLGCGGEALGTANGIRRQMKCERVDLIVSEWLLGRAEQHERRWHA